MTINKKVVGMLAIMISVSFLAIGCAADPNGPDVATNKQQLTLEELVNLLFPPIIPEEVTQKAASAAACADDLAVCVRKADAPSALVACNEDYVQCVAAVVDITLPDLPASDLMECAENAVTCARDATSVATFAACGPDMTDCAADAVGVGEIVDGMRACAGAAANCTLDAEAGSEALQCAETNVSCVGATLGVDIPDLPGSELVECAETAAQCTLAAKKISAIETCAQNLRDCNAEVIDVLKVVDEVVDCNVAAAKCAADATRPSTLAACAEAQADCVADALDITLPNIPVAEATKCAEDAAKCTAKARNLRALAACGSALTECAAEVVEPAVDCGAEFTACVFENPFNLLGCVEQNLICLSE